MALWRHGESHITASQQGCVLLLPSPPQGPPKNAISHWVMPECRRTHCSPISICIVGLRFGTRCRWKMGNYGTYRLVQRSGNRPLHSKACSEMVKCMPMPFYTHHFPVIFSFAKWNNVDVVNVDVRSKVLFVITYIIYEFIIILDLLFMKYRNNTNNQLAFIF